MWQRKFEAFGNELLEVWALDKIRCEKFDDFEDLLFWSAWL